MAELHTASESRPGTRAGLLLDAVLVLAYLVGAVAVARDGDRFAAALVAMLAVGAAWAVVRAGIVVATSRGHHARERRSRAGRRARRLLVLSVAAGVVAALVVAVPGEGSVGDGVVWSLIAAGAVLVGVVAAAVGLFVLGLLGGVTTRRWMHDVETALEGGAPGR